MSVLSILATISFILAPCFLVACVVIFLKLRVLDAILFLQHKPTSHRASGGFASRAKGRAGRIQRKQKEAQEASKASPTGEDDAADKNAETASAKKKVRKKKSGGTKLISPVQGEAAVPSSPKDDSKQDAKDLDSGAEQEADVLDQGASERDTDVLVVGGSEAATDVLVLEGSEAATDVLVSDQAENPTELLSEEPTENPTEALTEDDAAELATEVLVIEQLEEELGFMFRIKQDIVVVHTEEKIG